MLEAWVTGRPEGQPAPLGGIQDQRLEWPTRGPTGAGSLVLNEVLPRRVSRLPSRHGMAGAHSIFAIGKAGP